MVQAAKDWAKNNRARHNANTKRWKEANPEKAKEMRDRQYAKMPKDIFVEKVMLRHAAKKKAMPTWANRAYIKMFYQLAREESERTGRKVHVDHIVPLTSAIVCGLHNEHNLQLLFASDNMSKHNRYWPQMP